MRFNKVHIRSAGPIRDRTVRFQDVNLIVGNNEEGKTTLMDILIGRLLSGPYAKSVASGRFDLETGVTVETEGPELSEEAVRLQSLFVIREGEARWKGRDIKNRDDIRKREIWNDEIKEILHGNDPYYARIQSDLTGVLGVAKKNSWLCQMEANAKDLLDTCVRQAGLADGLRALEAEIVRDRAEITRVETEMRGLSEARKNRAAFEKLERLERYFRLTDERRDLEEKIQKLSGARLDAVKEEWTALESGLSALDRDLARLSERISRASEVRKETEARVRDLRERLDRIQDKKRDAVLEREKILARKAVREDAFRKAFSRFDERRSAGMIRVFRALAFAWGGVCVLGAAALVLTAAGVFPRIAPDWAYWSAAGGPFVPFGVFFVMSLLASRKAARFRAERDALEREFAPALSLSSRDLAALDERIAEMEADHKAAENGGQTAAESDPVPERARAEERRKKLLEKRSEFLKIYGGLESVVAGLSDLTNFRGRLGVCLRELAALEKDVTRDWGSLSATVLRDAQEKLRRDLESEGREAVYSEERYRELERRKDALNESVRRQGENLQNLSGDITARIEEAVANAARGFKTDAPERFYPDLKNLGLSGDVFNIYALRERVRAFAGRVEQDRKMAEIVAAAFDSAQSRLDTLVGSVLGTDAFRSVFSRVTNGTYTGVETEIPGDRLDIRFRHKNGELYAYENLSTGTRNQFHIAFRLSLAQGRYGTQPGVFLLDDAFLSFDSGRRNSALGLLADWAREGWQIIYATVNEGGMQGAFESVFGGKLNTITLAENP